MTFGNRLRALRVASGVSQGTLAEALGISRLSIGNYERGRREPESKTVVRAAKLFNTTTDYLLGLTDIPTKPTNTELTMSEYQSLAQRTSSTKTKPDKLLNGVMGLNGEAGECIDLIKKHYFQGHELDEEKLVGEISDVLWYCAELASGLGVSLGDIARHNIAKLKKRYPDGFSAERSVNRE